MVFDVIEGMVYFNGELVATLTVPEGHLRDMVVQALHSVEVTNGCNVGFTVYADETFR